MGFGLDQENSVTQISPCKALTTNGVYCNLLSFHTGQNSIVGAQDQLKFSFAFSLCLAAPGAIAICKWTSRRTDCPLELESERT